MIIFNWRTTPLIIYSVDILYKQSQMLLHFNAPQHFIIQGKITRFFDNICGFYMLFVDQAKRKYFHFNLLDFRWISTFFNFSHLFVNVAIAFCTKLENSEKENQFLSINGDIDL